MAARGRRATRGGAAAAEEKSTWVSGAGANNTMEIHANEDIEMQEPSAGAGAEPKVRPPWQKVGPDGKPIKRKPNPARRNAMFRKHLQPKTAIMCLNELITGLKYTVEPLESIGNFAASVEVNGVTYRGYGSSKMLAKQAAAEAALVSFVKPPPPKSAPGQEEPLDETPWKTIASFAMYKLFAEWSEGNAGRQAPSGPLDSGAQAMPGDLRNYLTQLQQDQQPTNAATFAQAPVAKKAKAPKAANNATPQPAKLSDDVKASMHPVMAVNQLNPGIEYTSEEQMDAQNTRIWSVSAIVNGQQFFGSGPNTKKAKLACAKTILYELHGVTSQYEAPTPAAN